MPRELSEPLTEEDKVWMRSRNMEIPEEAEAEDESADDELPDDYNDWTIPQLKAELARPERKLPVSGTKDELIARLVEDDEKG